MADNDNDSATVPFMNSQTGWIGNQADWVGVKKLGQGGQGSAGLWVKRDPVTQKITARLVVKETVLHDWNNWTVWGGKGNRIPLEVYTSQLMKRDYNTVEIFAHRVYENRHAFRAYMEFCALGDLGTIDKLYRKNGRKVPEPFIWRLFEDLARAAFAMENPTSADEKFGTGSYVAHMDIKPGNIFMCPPDADYFPKYPEAKLGDFGAAWLSNPRDTLHGDCERLYHSVHTPAYVPPEAKRIMNDDDDVTVPSREFFHYTMRGRLTPSLPDRGSSALNIWNIGIVMADLMASHKYPGSSWPSQAYKEREDWLANLLAKDFEQTDHYSKDLKQLVKDCVRFFPQDRPSATNIMQRVKKGITDHAGIMRNKTCLDKNKYNGVHDLDPEYNMTDEFHVERAPDDEDWDDLDNAGSDDDDDDDNDLSDDIFSPRKRKSGSTTRQGAASRTSTRFQIGANATNSIRNFFAGRHARTSGDFVGVPSAVPFRTDRISLGGLAAALADSIGAAGGAVASAVSGRRRGGRSGLSSVSGGIRVRGDGVRKSVRRK